LKGTDCSARFCGRIPVI